MSLNDIRAEAENGIEKDEMDGFGPDRPLSLKDTDDVPLAPAARNIPESILNDDGSVPTWSFGAIRYRCKMREESSHCPRFGHHWANRTRAKLLRADECMRRWVDTTTLLTYTGEPYFPDTSCPIPPVSFTTALTASRPTRRKAMRSLFDEVGGRWMSIRVMGSHKSGYPHEHVLVGTESQVSNDDFEPVVSAHRDKSPIAGEGEHGVGAISVEQSPNKEDMTGGIQYIATNVPGVTAVLKAEELGQTSNGVLDEPEHMVRTSAVLEATGTQAFHIDRSDGVEKIWY